MKKMILVAIAMNALISSAAMAEEWTISQAVSRIQFDGASTDFYLVGGAKWGASSCPNATYIWIKSDVPGRKEVLAIAIAAQTAGKVISVLGTCSSDADYFEGRYVVVQ